MNLLKINTETGYKTVATGANVELSYRDALFLFHAFNTLRDNMKVLQDEVLQLTDNIEPNAMLRDTSSIIQSMDNLLMPIATEVVIPKETIDIFNYVSEEEPIDAEPVQSNTKTKAAKNDY